MFKKLTRTDVMIHSVVKLILFYLLMLFVMSLFRVFFAYYFGTEGLWTQNTSDLFKAFILGLRYDTMVISYIIAPVFLFLSLGALIKSKWLMSLILFFSHKWSYLLSLLVIFLLISDMAFYMYFQDHLNILFFGLFEDDTKAVLIGIQKNYPLEIALAILFVFFVFWYLLLKKIFKNFDNKKSLTHGNAIGFFLFFILPLALLFGGARGSFSDLPLSPKYAAVSKNSFVNLVALNGIVTFERAFKLRNEFSNGDLTVAKTMGYGGNPHRAYSDYLGFDTTPTSVEDLPTLLNRKTPKNEIAETVKPHVVVFVMESFGMYWLNFHSQEFNLLGELEKHMQEDFVFNRFVSADNGTIGSLLAITTNIPHRPQSRFLSESEFLDLKLPTSSLVPFSNRGYETTFIYGGKLAWRDLGKYATKQGFHNVEGEEHVKEALHLKGEVGTEWGIFDEYLYDYVYQKLETSTRPQFILVMTTTNHPSYDIPKSYTPKSLNPSSELSQRIVREENLIEKRFSAFQYSNDRLGNFLNRIKSAALKENSIISFTGDHNFWGFINYSDEEIFSKYRVPFYLYVPEALRPKEFNKDKLGGHQDIMTTLYNLSLSETSYTSFGQDMFSSQKSFAINTSVHASPNGVSYAGQLYSFKPESDLVETTSVAGDPELETYYRSLLSVADFYLRSELEKSKKKED